MRRSRVRNVTLHKKQACQLERLLEKDTLNTLRYRRYLANASLEGLLEKGELRRELRRAPLDLFKARGVARLHLQHVVWVTCDVESRVVWVTTPPAA